MSGGVAAALPEMLGRLKLNAIRDLAETRSVCGWLDGLLDEAARRDLTLPETLVLLCEAEVAHREERRIQMGLSRKPLRGFAGIARFPCVRTLEGFDFPAQPSLDPKQVRDLAACRWVANGDTLLIQGPPGVGKSHLAVALGREAVSQGYSVLFTTATALVTTLVKGQTAGWSSGSRSSASRSCWSWTSSATCPSSRRPRTCCLPWSADATSAAASW